MNAFMDSLWLKIMVVIGVFHRMLDVALGPLNALGPVAAISVIALLTVILTKVLSKTIRTRRHAELKKEFLYWHGIRQEALKTDDDEKGRLLAKNIDQAELNRVYYDFFFESLMLNLVTKYLPILIFLAYVNETYRPETMERLFGQEVLFHLSLTGSALPVGPVFWFVSSLVAFYCCWPLAARGVKRLFGRTADGFIAKNEEALSQNGS